MGGELEFVDSGTLSRALRGRRAVDVNPAEEVS
jgi:recombinational DNA repair protein RecR